MKLTIVSPEKILFQGDAVSVTVPGTKGHAPIISSLQKGTLTYKGESEVSMEISGGFIDVANNKVAICIEL